MANTHPPRHQLPADLAAEMRAHRLRRGIGLRTAALAAGIWPGYLSLLELGKRCPSIDVAQDLDEALKYPPDLRRRLFETARPASGRAARRLRAQGTYKYSR